MPNHKAAGRKGVFPPEDLRIRLQNQLRVISPSELAERLGVGRVTVLGVAAGSRSLAGTLALIRERLPALERGGDKA